MSDMIVFDTEVGEDRKLVVQLPPDAPQGQVRVTIEKITPHDEPELTPEEEAALDAEFEALINDPKTFTGLGLSAEEIAKSPEIGLWKDREDMKDSAEWVSKMRRQSTARRLKRED